jgi:hypothetical protein
VRYTCRERDTLKGTFCYCDVGYVNGFTWKHYSGGFCLWGLRRRSAAARLLRLWVRIPPGAWMFVCCECCVFSGRGLCDGLITGPEESYRLWCVVYDLETSWKRRPWPTGGGGLLRQKQTPRNWKGQVSDISHIIIPVIDSTSLRKVRDYSHRPKVKQCTSKRVLAKLVSANALSSTACSSGGNLRKSRFFL